MLLWTKSDMSKTEPDNQKKLMSCLSILITLLILYYADCSHNTAEALIKSKKLLIQKIWILDIKS